MTEKEVSYVYVLTPCMYIKFPSEVSRAEHNLVRKIYPSTDSAGVGKHLQVGGLGRFLRREEDWIFRNFET